tara:strand:+ start:407 stop:574 length:168 start_codon:yes stop_codon:yes gene_type:complete
MGSLLDQLKGGRTSKPSSRKAASKGQKGKGVSKATSKSYVKAAAKKSPPKKKGGR